MASYKLKYTAEEIDGILESVDEKTIYDDATQSKHGLMSATDKTKLDALPSGTQIEESLQSKVDKVDGKGLSENDYTDEDKASVASAYHKPSSGIPKNDLDQGVQTSLGRADTALQSFTETDPTVPSWAKQLTKPSYTASEVGAVSVTRKVNGKALSSDITLGASDVGALPTSTSIPTKTSQLTNDSGFVAKSVNDLVNYYLKSETYTKSEVQSLVSSLGNFHYEIYASLPQSGQGNVLYLIGPTGAGSDRYEEYVYASNAFVKIGDTSIDLSGYVTASALDAALSAYTTTSDLTTLLSSKQDKIDSSHKLDYSLIANTPTIPTVPTISTDIASDASDNTKTASPKAVKDYVDAHGGSGGEENVIETVKVNGTALTPDSDKAVDITVPTALASLSDDSTHRTVTDTEKSTWSGKSDFSGSYNDLTNKPTIPTAQIQSDWSQSDNTAKDYIKNKPTIPAAQVNADWNASSGVAQILNKPTIPLEDLIVTFTLNAPDYSHGTTDYTTSQIATEAARGRKVYLKQSGVDTLIPATYIDSQEVVYSLLEGYLTNDGLGGIIPESYISTYVQKDDVVTINSEQFNSVAFDGESDPVFTASAAYGITSSDITNWNSKGTYSKPSGGIPASDLASGVIPDISGKADAATTLAGYGITDAKIESGVITLGSNTITPLTSHQSLSDYVQKSQTAGLLKNDGTVDQTQYGTYSKPSNGIPASDLESGVIPTVPVQDVTVGGSSVLNNNVAVIPAIPDISGKADKTLVASSMPSGGFLPNVVYNLGALSGNTTFSMAAATDNTIANIWCWTFTTPSTAPTIAWPAAITGWSGGSQPTINASKSYEITVMNGLATIIES